MTCENVCNDWAKFGISGDKVKGLKARTFWISMDERENILQQFKKVLDLEEIFEWNQKQFKI